MRLSERMLDKRLRVARKLYTRVLAHRHLLFDLLSPPDYSPGVTWEDWGARSLATGMMLSP